MSKARPASVACHLKRPHVRKLAFFDVDFFRRRRLPTENMIAVRLTAKGRDDLADGAGLFNQGLIDRLEMSRNCRGNFLAQANEEIEAFEVIRTFAVTERQGVDDFEPRMARA